MKLLELELRNVRQHRSLKHKFKAGITGIMGPSGTGKSHLLRAIRANLTGDFGSDSLKERNVCRWAKSSESSYVAATWQHGEQTFTLTRGLQKCVKQELVLPTGALTKAGEITETLERLLGFSLDYAFDQLFVPQWKIFEFLSVRPEDRLKALARLCHVDDLEDLWSLLGKFIAEDQKLITTIDEAALLLAQQRREELCKRLQNLLRKVTVLQEAVLTTEARSQLLADLKTHIARRALLQKKLQVAHRYRQAKQDFAEARKQLVQVTRRYRQLFQQLQEAVEGQETAQTQLNELLAQKKLQGTAELHRVVLSHPPPAEPARPEDYQEPAEVAAEQRRLRALETQLRGEIRSLMSAPDKCHVCGHDWTEARSFLQAKQAELKGIMQQLESFRRLPAWQTYDRDRASYTEAYQSWSNRRRLAEEWFQSNPAVEPRELAQQIGVCEATLQGFTGLQRQVDRAEADLKQVQGQVDSLRKQLLLDQHTGRRCNEQLAQATSLPAEQRRVINRTLRRSEKARVLLQAKQELVANTEENLRQTESQIDRAVRLRKASLAATSWVDDLVAWRDVVRRDGLPQVAMRAYLQDVVRGVNSQLEAFDSPFTVSESDDLSLLAEHADGAIEPVSELSGGQKVVLAIAYHLTVNEHDFLALDEPTAGLDRTNLDFLAEALINIRAVARRDGRQILLVTHDDRLERVFDDVIRLERAKEL